MKVIRDIDKMQEFARQVRLGGLTIGFVPTMGFLHEGHLELVRNAQDEADVVVVSIFDNPTQFDRSDDFDAYPRDDARDRALLEGERVEVLFMPEADEVYLADAATRVGVNGLTDTLCGPGRPGHFEGVTTVVAALFNMVMPDVAVFGEKDYQQLCVIRRMARDLHSPVRIASAPTVREPDGLAMSSRNARLSADERAIAPAIHRGLQAATDAYLAGERRCEALLARAREVLDAAAAIEVEYLQVVDGSSLRPVGEADDGSVIAIAAGLGPVRLIDNIMFARARRERDAAHRLDSAETVHVASGVVGDA